MILVGYQGDSKNYRLYDEATDKVIVSRDVIFKEISSDVKFENVENPSIFITNKKTNNINENITDEENFTDYEDATEQEPRKKSPSPKSKRLGINYELRNTTTHDTIKPPDRFSACVVNCIEPKTYTEAIKGENAEK